MNTYKRAYTRYKRWFGWIGWQSGMVRWSPLATLDLYILPRWVDDLERGLIRVADKARRRCVECHQKLPGHKFRCNQGGGGQLQFNMRWIDRENGRGFE